MRYVTWKLRISWAYRDFFVSFKDEIIKAFVGNGIPYAHILKPVS